MTDATILPTSPTNRLPASGRRGQTALITGASTGIGYELAKLFAADGYKLVLIARNRQALEALSSQLSAAHGVKALVMDKDLSDPAAPRQIVDALEAGGVEVDVLVNNAGFGSQGPFAEAEETQQVQMVQVNVAAPTHLTRLILPGMLSRGRGRIMNVASVASFLPGPLMAVYYATKAYLLSFSEALSEELRQTPVTVTVLCPGPTKTEFEKRGNISKTRPSRHSVMDATSVARIGYTGMHKGRRRVIPGLSNRVLVLATKFTPRNLATTVARKLNRRT